jgi:uncharacterized protein (TIGR04141 family)
VPPPLQKLHVRLLKASVRRVDHALEDADELTWYDLKAGLGFDGRLYVAPPKQGPPAWLRFVQTGIQGRLAEVTNRTNAAVLLIRRARRIFAFTFGYGWRFLREDLLEPDFGLKAALNGVQHDSLQSLDSFAVEEQTVHRRSQASRASALQVFGIDVSRDILRAVTGRPREGVPLQAITGSGNTLAISVATDFRGLGDLSDLVLSLYRMRTYREHFSFVDFVQRVSDPKRVEELDERVLNDLRSEAPASYLAPPEPVDLGRIHQFGYTGARRQRTLDMDIATYLANVDEDDLATELLHHHKVSAYGDDDHTPVHGWPVYRCLVFEATVGESRFVFTAGQWFEIDRDFAAGIRRTARQIPVSGVQLPHLNRLANGRLEGEPAYNKRVAREDTSMALMDGKNARCLGTTTGIEVCDLLSGNGDLIHVKHRKGGSSSLSHLFAQGRMSAEALTRDPDFRHDGRRHLRRMRAAWAARIPVKTPNPRNFCVVFAILGGDEDDPADDLPFFSQLNLVRTFQALNPLQYGVAVLGVPVGN